MSLRIALHGVSEVSCRNLLADGRFRAEMVDLAGERLLEPLLVRQKRRRLVARDLRLERRNFTLRGNMERGVVRELRRSLSGAGELLLWQQIVR